MNGQELQVVTSLLKVKGWDGEVFVYLLILLFIYFLLPACQS